MAHIRTIYAFGKRLPPGIAWSVSALEVLFLVFLLTPLSVSAQQANIQKCQDNNGNWYYGNSINTACVSKISVLNRNGVQLRQRSPFQPVSLQQLQAQQQQKTADVQILRRYSSIDSIKQERARKLAELTRQRQINVELIDRMDRDTQQLISQNKPDIASALEERQTAVEKYQGRRNKLYMEILSLDSTYERITLSYLEALSRKEPQ